MEVKDIEYTPNYIMVSFDRHDTNFNREAYSAEKWCQQSGFGKRVNRWTFAFKTEPDYLMFRLKWIK